MAQKRVTNRNMRVTKRGQVTSAAHIDKRNDTPEKRAEVIVSRCVGFNGRMVDGDLEAYEADFYERYFRDGLDAQNRRYEKKQGKKSARIRTMDEYRKGAKTCPEDSLFYIGCMGNTATDAELLACYLDYLEWRGAAFPLVKPLGFGLHKEKGAYHIEEHHVWMARDADGNWISDQGKALEQMGVQRPEPGEKVGRYNNAKMTYTAECRQKWIEIAKAHEFEIIEEPRERGKSGLSLNEYVTRQLQEERREAEKGKQEAEQATEKAQAALQKNHEAARMVLQDIKAMEKIAGDKQKDVELWIRTEQNEQRRVAELQREMGDMTEFKRWKAEKAAQEAQEAARKKQEEDEAKRAAEAARKAQEAQKQKEREEQARKAAEAAQRAARPKTDEERYQEARAAIFGGSVSPEPPRRKAPSVLDGLRQKAETARDSKPGSWDGLDGP